MELSWLEDFLALAESRNFSRAAERRHMTQPAFSRRIRLLEDWAGAILFNRSGQPIALTEAGQRLQPTAEAMLRQLAQAREEMRQAAGAGATALHFAATHSLSLTFFPAWIQAVGTRLELGPIHLLSESMLACERAMLEGDAQFMLCHCHAAAPPRLVETHFISKVIDHDRLLPVMAPNLDAQHAPLLGYGTESAFARILAAAPQGQNQAKPVFTSHSAAVLRMMARDGRGLAWLPHSLIHEDLQTGALRALPDAALSLDIRLYRPRARQSHLAEAFWAALAAATDTP